MPLNCFGWCYFQSVAHIAAERPDSPLIKCVFYSVCSGFDASVSPSAAQHTEQVVSGTEVVADDLPAPGEAVRSDQVIQGG